MSISKQPSQGGCVFSCPPLTTGAGAEVGVLLLLLDMYSLRVFFSNSFERRVITPSPVPTQCRGHTPFSTENFLIRLSDFLLTASCSSLLMTTKSSETIQSPPKGLHSLASSPLEISPSTDPNLPPVGTAAAPRLCQPRQPQNSPVHPLRCV